VSRDKDALLDILEQIELIQQHGPRDERALVEDVVVQAATLHWLAIIGEAANRVSDELRAAHPEVPWRGIVATRNVVAHGYDQVRLDIVWRVIQDDLPPLRAQVDAIVEDIE
jgi:uncharacterized protein with HEPN domain